MLYLIGLGLADEKDISVKGLEIVKGAKEVYLEAYTSMLLVDKEKLETFYARPLHLADRQLIESSLESTILHPARTADIALLVAGDPFSATTHSDLLLRARALRIPHAYIPNASILTAVGVTGLQLYHFGQTVSLPFFAEEEGVARPVSFYDRIAENAGLGLHTLVLLDIRVREPDYKAMWKRGGGSGVGGVVYEPPRFMSVATAARQLLDVEEDVRRAVEERGKDEEVGEADRKRRPGVCARDRLAVGVARLGSDGQRIAVGTLEQLADVDLGPPLHSLIILGSRLHVIERDMLSEWAIDRKLFDEICSRDFEHCRREAVHRAKDEHGGSTASEQ